MSTRAKIEALARRPAQKAAMEVVESLTLTPEDGVVEDYGKSRRRQVTLLSKEAWEDAERELDHTLPWHTRRANILVSGLTFDRAKDYEIRLGDCRVRVHGETVPCQQMDDAHDGLRKALEPSLRGGVYGEILVGGTVRAGDVVEILGG